MKSRVKYMVGLALLTAVTVHAQAPAPVQPVLGPPAMVEKVGQLAAQIDADAKHIQHLQAVARKEKDVIKLTCVNDTIVQLKAKQDLFEESRRQFESMLEPDLTAARGSFNDLTTTAKDVTDLRATAEACIGVPELYKQESAISVDSPVFPDDPTTTDPFQPDVEPPAYASPYN